jgi:ATP-dependent Clp protease ATP-binding subunit ClpC
MLHLLTDRARKSFGLARAQAQRLSHPYIATEHVLLGIVQEGGGVGASILRNFDIDLKTILQEVEGLVILGSKVVPVMRRMPFTQGAKEALELALDEASSLSHNYIGTEHLLVGLIRERRGIAARVLAGLNVKLDAVREEISMRPRELPPQ